MKTMKQHPENDYDIDDGVAFSLEKLTNKDGSPMTPGEAKQMVRGHPNRGGWTQGGSEGEKKLRASRLFSRAPR